MKRFLFTLFLISSVLIPAISANATSSRWLAVLMGEKVSQVFLDDVIDSITCDLDATISDSYSGSGQTWANLIVSPNDGAAQTDYDFFLGADGNSSTDDPTFTGTAGDSGAYFSLDGADFFHQVIAASSNPTVFQDMSKAGAAWWMAFGLRTAATFQTLNVLFENGALTGDGVNGLRLAIRASVSGTLQLVVDNSDQNIINDVGDAMGNSTDTLYIISYSGNDSEARIWTNSTTKNQFAITPTVNSNSNTANQAGLFAEEDNTAGWGNGTRVYHVSIGNAYIDDADAALIFTHLEARHNRDYTP